MRTSVVHENEWGLGFWKKTTRRIEKDVSFETEESEWMLKC